MRDNDAQLYFKEDAAGICFRVRLSPRSSKEGLEGVHGDAIKLKVKSPPVDGKANKAMLKFLSKCLGIPMSGIKILSGQTSRIKTVRAEGVSETEVRTRLGLR
jgi:uncharacterized protein (TIGR00251 family)